MKTLFAVLLLSCAALAQTNTFCPVGGNCNYTGTNTWAGSSTFNGATTLAGGVAGTTTAFTGGATIGTTLGVTGQITASDGTAAAPGYSFTSSAGSGLFQYGPGNIGISSGGTAKAQWAATFMSLIAGYPLAWNSGGGNSSLDAGISRTGPGALAVGNGTQGNASGSLAAGAVNLIQFPTSGADCGIQAAYNALPSTGGEVVLGADCTITAAQTITLTIGKPLKLDFAGRTITCTLASSGTCLKFIKPDSTPRYRMDITGSGGALTASGATTNVIGLQLGDPSNPAPITDVRVAALTIKNFSTSGSIGLLTDWVEEGDFNWITLASNATGAKFSSTTTVTTIQNSMCNSTFQQNTVAVVMQDVSEFTFCDNTVQSNTSQKAFVIKTVNGNDANIRLLRNHFENNGDTTNASRQISLQPAAGKSISRVEMISNVFNGGAQFPNGATNIEATGATTDAGGIKFAYNTYNNGTACTGFGAGRGIESIFDNCNAYDVGVNDPTTATPWGLTFAPVGAAKKYQVYAGFPAQFDGSLVFRDLTAGADIARFGSSTWDFLTNLVKANQFQSVVATGTAPLAVASTTPVANLTVQNCSTCVLTGTPTGTGIQTATLKTGSGAGNYTTASLTFVRVDSTNLAYTVTIPTGWKLIVNASGSVSQATATAGVDIALADGSADNTGILAVVHASPGISGVDQFSPFALNWIVTGDGASHTINLQFLTGNASDSAIMSNSSSTIKPQMTFLLTPSN